MSYSHLLILLAFLVSSLIKNLSFVQHISSISNHTSSIFVTYRRIRNTIDQTTACTITTSLIHSKIDYCNSLVGLLNLSASQTNRLQLVLNSAARAVTKTPKFHHITPILKSLYCLKINERINYNVVSLTHINLSTFLPPLSSFIPFTSLYSVFFSYHP